MFEDWGSQGREGGLEGEWEGRGGGEIEETKTKIKKNTRTKCSLGQNGTWGTGKHVSTFRLSR